MSESDAWDCVAYGPEGADVGALCFLAEQDERACTSEAMCHLTMAAERSRLFSLIHEQAAAGDPVMTYLSGEFTHPDQLLGGPANQAADPPTHLP